MNVKKCRSETVKFLIPVLDFRGNLDFCSGKQDFDMTHDVQCWMVGIGWLDVDRFGVRTITH